MSSINKNNLLEDIYKSMSSKDRGRLIEFAWNKVYSQQTDSIKKN